MKKLLTTILLSGLCVSAVPTQAWHCVHVHESNDWAAPLAFGAIGGTMLGLAASSASHDHAVSSRSRLIDDLQDQNDLLRAKLNSLKESYADLREENNELREENEALRRKIKKLKHFEESVH